MLRVGFFSRSESRRADFLCRLRGSPGQRVPVQHTLYGWRSRYAPSSGPESARWMCLSSRPAAGMGDACESAGDGAGAGEPGVAGDGEAFTEDCCWAGSAGDDCAEVSTAGRAGEAGGVARAAVCWGRDWRRPGVRIVMGLGGGGGGAIPPGEEGGSDEGVGASDLGDWSGAGIGDAGEPVAVVVAVAAVRMADVGDMNRSGGSEGGNDLGRDGGATPLPVAGSAASGPPSCGVRALPRGDPSGGE